MAKNRFKILDILKIHIYNYFYILEAYNCQKEFKKNEKHGFQSKKTSFFNVFCHLLKTRFCRSERYGGTFFSNTVEYFYVIFSRGKRKLNSSETYALDFLKSLSKVGFWGGSVKNCQIFGVTPQNRTFDKNFKNPTIRFRVIQFSFTSRKDQVKIFDGF